MRIHASIVVGLACLALATHAGCSSDGGDSGASSGKPVIKIAHNDWLSAKLNDVVCKIVLEEKLGYRVELIDAGTSDQWPSVAKGDLHVSLEVWPSGHPSELQRYLKDEKTVEDGGLLGPVARVGWFIPTYLLTLHPELATWEGLKKPENVALFKSPETGEKGRFLGGDPKWVQWDQQIIDNLGLDFKVVFAGSEDAEIAALDAVYPTRGAILFYFWEPHWALANHDLTLLELPPSDPVCWSKQLCGYPSDPLFKILWPGLKDLAPEAYQFFKNVSYAAADQVQMMSAVKNGATVEEAARTWVDTHEAVWGAWLPTKSTK